MSSQQLTPLDVVMWQEIFRHQGKDMNTMTSGDVGASIQSYLKFAAIADQTVALRMQQRAAAEQQQRSMQPMVGAPLAPISPLGANVNMQQPTHLSMPPVQMPPNVSTPMPPGGRVELIQGPPAPPPLDAGPVAPLPPGVPLHGSGG